MSANYAIAAGHLREAKARVHQAADAIRDELLGADLVMALETEALRLEMMRGWIDNAIEREPPTPRPKIPVT
ncbi:MAG TPA: hypothetical protein VK797_23365 [Tepidisphaeraceae bacterium]|jgi:hypothetical protein|nr:hypothetical protein [Tepidisphaeraceae bacterium]